MRKRWSPILFLLATALALWALVQFVSDRDSQNVGIASIDRAALKHIEITRKQKTTLKFEKRDGRWWITEPLTAPAEEDRMTLIMSIADTPSHTHYSVAQADLSRFGLRTPQATLLLGGTRIDFGDTDPIRRQRYTLVGDTLHLLEDVFLHLLVASESDFLDKKLLPHGEPIRLEIPGIRITRTRSGKWVSLRTDRRDYTRLFQAWKNASASSVTRLEETVPAPADTVRVEFEDAPPLIYVILPRTAETVLARPDLNLAFQLSDASAQELLPPLEGN